MAKSDAGESKGADVADLERERERLRQEQGAESASAADRADAENGNGELHQDEQAVLFPEGVVEGDSRVTIKNLIRAGEDVDLEVTLMQGKVPLRGGLIDPRRPGKVVVSHEAAKYLLIPKREGEPGDKRVKAWTARIQLRPTYTEPAANYWSEEEVLHLLDTLGLPRSSDRVQEILAEHRKAA